MNFDTTTASSLSHTNTSGEDCDWNISEISSTVTNLLIGLPLNSYMAWMISTHHAQMLVSCFFELNMSLTELLFMALSPLKFLNNCKYLNYPTAMNFVSNFSYGILLFGRPLFQTLICVERYMAVVHPVVFLKFRVLRYKLTCSTVGWLIVLTVSLILAIYKEMVWYMLMVNTLILIVVKLFCFLAVLRALTQPQPGDGGREGERANQAKMRAFKIILLLLISTIVQYVPLLVVWFLYAFQQTPSPVASDIVLFTVIGAGFIQPLLFLQRTGKLFCKGIPLWVSDCVKMY